MRIITKDRYPETLREAKGVPQSLYIRGELPPEHYKYLCVVGSRTATEYGRESAWKIISGLRGYPISIVSGLAIGIDSIAHRAALENDLHCTVFPGSTLAWNEIYPREHEGLAREIAERGGALLSEWPPAYPTEKWAFPARNRLMAGLAQATLIIEAGRGSGSLLTAKHAEENHRDIFAVPGPISAPQSYGPHMLIRKGAALISSARDVLSELGFNLPQDQGPSGAISLTIPQWTHEDPVAASLVRELRLQELSIDDLLKKIGVSIVTLNEKISLLEIEGVIRRRGIMVQTVT